MLSEQRHYFFPACFQRKVTPIKAGNPSHKDRQIPPTKSPPPSCPATGELGALWWGAFTDRPLESWRWGSSMLFFCVRGTRGGTSRSTVSMEKTAGSSIPQSRPLITSRLTQFQLPPVPTPLPRLDQLSLP